MSDLQCDYCLDYKSECVCKASKEIHLLTERVKELEEKLMESEAWITREDIALQESTKIRMEQKTQIKELQELVDQKIKQMEFLTVDGNNMRGRIKELEDALEDIDMVKHFKNCGYIRTPCICHRKIAREALNRSKETK